MANCARMKRTMESECIKPMTVEGTAETVALRSTKDTAEGTVRPTPLPHGKDSSPFIGDMTNAEKTFEESLGEWRRRARKMHRLAGIVGVKLDGVGKGAHLCFGGLKQNGKTRQRKDLAKMVAGCSEIEGI